MILLLAYNIKEQAMNNKGYGTDVVIIMFRFAFEETNQWEDGYAILSEEFSNIINL